MTITNKAPERIWAWDDKTPTERDKGWSACDAGTGSTEYVSADLHEAARSVIARLADERDQAINALSKAAEARGRAEGKLEASELPGIVDGWKARAERAEAERDTALAQVAAAYKAAERALEARKYGDPDEREEYAFDAALDRGIVAIRALTPADASAALSRMLDEAYAAGQERMREAAADEVDSWDLYNSNAVPLEDVVAETIRALPITPRPDRGIGRECA